METEEKIMFPDIPGTGNLYSDRTLFEFDYEPIIFTCKDILNNRYFCVQDDDIQEYSWIAIPISKEDISRIAAGKMTILTPFKESSDETIIITSDLKQQSFTYSRQMYSSIPEEELPVKDFYMKEI